MYNLMIVSNDKSLRDGLAAKMDWNGLGFDNVICLDDGIKALEYLYDHLVHLTLVDVQMQPLTGLEMLAQCQLLRINTSFVFVTARGAVQFAQAAVNLGSKGFLLQPANPVEIKLLLTKIIRSFQSGGECLDKRPKDEKIYASAVPDYVKKAVLYVQTNFGEKHTLTSISKYLYISPAYFGIAFKKATGLTFTDYVTSVKISKAKEFIVTYPWSIKEVALESGYEDYTYFCKVFKKQTGMTPLEYRKHSLLHAG